MGRSFVIVIDGLGVGAQEDAVDYGDTNANTLANVSRIGKTKLPNFQKLGLANIIPLESTSAIEKPDAAFGKMREVSAGKDSTTGHWEIAGIHLENPFPTYPDGFPEDLLEKFCNGIDVSSALCNQPYSGTKVIDDFGDEHLQTGKPIIYTSADSVFQVACHKDIVSVEKLYEWCDFARKKICINEHAVGRVIARPFEGESGNFTRISDQRHDFSLKAPEPNLISVLKEKGISVYSIGKIVDLFPDAGFNQYRRTKNNAEGLSQLLSLMSANIPNSFTFVNLIDTDQIYGHRQDPDGYARCLEEIDRAIPAILSRLQEDDLLIFTGDHGNDPADDSTDHTREFVPLIVVNNELKGKDLGIRSSFSDVASTVSKFHGLEFSINGTSFL